MASTIGKGVSAQLRAEQLQKGATREEEIEGFREKANFIVLDVRGDLQAVDFNDAERTLSAGDVFFEGNPFVGRKLLEAFTSKVTVLSIFLAPLSKEEILFLDSQGRSVSLADAFSPFGFPHGPGFPFR